MANIAAPITGMVDPFSLCATLLQELAQNRSQYYSIFGQALGSGFDATSAERIRIKWATGDFSQIPAIKILDSGMNGAKGAYASSTNTIYLSQDFWAGATAAQVVAVMLEEIGHSLDAQLNKSDSPGDEGEIFSNLVRGITLNDTTLQALRAENDLATIYVDGQPLSVETSGSIVPRFESLLVAEGGATIIYGLNLGTVPTSNVTITLNAGTQLSLNVSTLTFTPTNWNVPQAIRVSAIDDITGEGRHQGAITGTVASTDPNYNNLVIPALTVRITDNDLIVTGIRNYVAQTGTANPLNGADVGTFSKPILIDLDGDRDLDVVVGSSDGTLSYYRNTGTVTNPSYTIQTGTLNPFNGFDVGDFSSPAFADIDGDGDHDLIVGASDGTLKYYKNIGSPTSPSFIAQAGAANPFNNLDVGFLSSPTFADLDGDGDQDLIVGSADGKLQYYRNIGNATNPNFIAQTGAANPFNSFGVGANSVPTLFDVDNDGDFDLLVGENNGNFTYYRNIGTAASPSYQVQLDSLFYSISGLSYSSPALGDINADGSLDMISGTSNGTLKSYLNLPVVPSSDLGVSVNGANLEIAISDGIDSVNQPEIETRYEINITSINVQDPSNISTVDGIFTIDIGSIVLKPFSLSESPILRPSLDVLSDASLKIIDPSALRNVNNRAALLNALEEMEQEAITIASSSDLTNQRSAFLALLLVAVNKPEAEKTESEKVVLSWFGDRVKQNRIAERQKAIDLYNYWQANPYTHDSIGRPVPDRYQTPQGLGLEEYYRQEPNGLLALFEKDITNVPDLRNHAKAFVHEVFLKSAAGQVASENISKGLTRHQQVTLDAVSLAQSLEASGVSNAAIEFIIETVVPDIVVPLLEELAQEAIGKVLSVAAPKLLQGVGKAVFPYLAKDTIRTIGAAAGFASKGLAAATAGIGVVFSVAVELGFFLAEVFGSKALGLEGSARILPNLQNELAQALSSAIDLKALLQDDQAQNEFFTAFLEATKESNQSEIYLSNIADIYMGTDGVDYVYGRDGNDFLSGGSSGNDVLDGGKGNDILRGEVGNDILDGDDGNDELYGFVGNDTLYGCKGNDYLEGGLGSDTIYGEEGDDILYGGESNVLFVDAKDGDDLLNGGKGYDLAVYRGNLGIYQIKKSVHGGLEVKNIYTGDGQPETDTLLSIEKLQFRDTTLEVKDLNFPTFALFADKFTAPSNPNPINLNFNQAARQTGSLEPLNWVGTGNAQLSSILGDNILYLEAATATAALDRNLNGQTSQGGLRVSFDITRGSLSTGSAFWTGINLGLSATNKNAFINANVPHFGIYFQNDGRIQAFDGSNSVTGSYINTRWGDITNDARPLYSFSIILTDPTDNNPFNGVGQTNIDVYAEGSLIYSYVKTGGGYSDNYINFNTLLQSTIDNLEIENLEQGTIRFAENATGTVYTAKALSPDEKPLTYRLSGLDSNLFNINSTTGAITFKTAPDFEVPKDTVNADNVYDIIVIASDGLLETEKPISITVTNVNDAPSNISLSGSTVLENSGIGTLIGTLSSTDPDANNTFTYALVTGSGSTDNALFTINGKLIGI